MLDEIGVANINQLFDEIPDELKVKHELNLPNALNEMNVGRLMNERAKEDADYLNFIGAGAYEHHIPAAVWDIAGRGEFYTAYTPYQAEASQGTLQLIYEYQSMMASLTGMEVSNASLYDGATALAEAALMAVRIQDEQPKKILVPTSLHPHYRACLKAILQLQNIEIEELAYDPKTGQMVLPEYSSPAAALVIAQPNFFGCLENVDALTDWAHANNLLVIAVVNPMSLGLLKEPGVWGQSGADIVCGDGQPFGAPLASGGPYFGFLTSKKQFVREMPGRIVGRTVDQDGKPGFTLTLQAREQHIRRAKAKSNICTNQGLIVTAATICMSLLGPEGARKAAMVSHQQTEKLAQKFIDAQLAERIFTSPTFHEVVLKFKAPLEKILPYCYQHRVLPGLELSVYYPELKNCLLICATETKQDEDLEHLLQVVKAAI